MEKVNIFVSSTCYDLKQIRNDLRDFILSLGHTPILSEESNFPIDPQKGTIENCIEAVRSRADIFILIIGNRYGMPLDNGKSITNMEFLTAVEKNIPIYTFTTRQLVSILPIWRDNKDGNYRNVVDDSRIFEFAEEVRNKKFWNFEFETAQDIITTLKTQLSYLFGNALCYRKIFCKKQNYNTLYEILSPEALKLLLEQDGNYEARFFLQCCIDEIAKYKALKNDYTYSIILHVHSSVVSMKEFASWAQFKMSEVTMISDSANRLINVALGHFYAPPGVSSDLQGLYYTAQAYGRIYESILKWSIGVRSLCVDDDYVECRDALADMSKATIKEIEEFPIRALQEIYDGEERIKNGEENIKITSSMTFTIDDDTKGRYFSEIEKLRIKLSAGQISWHGEN